MKAQDGYEQLPEEPIDASKTPPNKKPAVVVPELMIPSELSKVLSPRKINSDTPSELSEVLSPRDKRNWPVALRISDSGQQHEEWISADKLDDVARETIKAPPPSVEEGMANKLPVLTSAFSPDGRWLAVGYGPQKPGKDGTRGELRLYEMINGYQEPALQEAIHDLAGDCH